MSTDKAAQAAKAKADLSDSLMAAYFGWHPQVVPVAGDRPRVVPGRHGYSAMIEPGRVVVFRNAMVRR